MQSGTISASQVYGGFGSNRMDLEDDPGDSELASGPAGGKAEKTPAMFFIGLVVLLVLIRVLYEVAK